MDDGKLDPIRQMVRDMFSKRIRKVLENMLATQPISLDQALEIMELKVIASQEEIKIAGSEEEKKVAEYLEIAMLELIADIGDDMARQQ